MKRLCLLLMLVVLTFGAAAHAMDAEMIRAETKTMTGYFSVEMDPSVNADSAYFTDASNGEKMWIDSFNGLEPQLKTFVEKTSANKSKVQVKGKVEYWTDGVILRQNEIIDYKEVK